MKKLNTLLILLALAIPATANAQEAPAEVPMAAPMAAASVGNFEIDAVHSTLGFAVKHMGAGKTHGSFNDFKGSISYDPGTMTLDADVTIVASSINTNNENRDNHLRSADFFDVANFPEITFKNAHLKQLDGKDIIFGDLTIKGVTKTVTIPVEISGPVAGMGGASALGISGSTTINRQDFGITFSKQMDNGGLVVDNNVDLIIDIEAKTPKVN